MEAYADYGSRAARVALFVNVKNAKELKTAVIEQKLPAALINPSLVADVFLLRLAAMEAASAEESNSMKTRSVYTEIIFQLSPSKQIKHALETIGIQDDSTALLLLTFEDDAKAQELCAMVEGSLVSPVQLQDLADLAAIRKAFKVQPAEEKMGSIVDAIATRMALKQHKNA
eukprot:m.32412 g.32412  ORF g.32412 m.32412 type:complete len:172 (-) comp12148_c0_seq2:1086-1601(-)